MYSLNSKPYPLSLPFSCFLEFCFRSASCVCTWKCPKSFPPTPSLESAPRLCPAAPTDWLERLKYSESTKLEVVVIVVVMVAVVVGSSDSAGAMRLRCAFFSLLVYRYRYVVSALHKTCLLACLSVCLFACPVPCLSLYLLARAFPHAEVPLDSGVYT